MLDCMTQKSVQQPIVGRSSRFDRQPVIAVETVCQAPPSALDYHNQRRVDCRYLSNNALESSIPETIGNLNAYEVYVATLKLTTTTTNNCNAFPLSHCLWQAWRVSQRAGS
jgi:hypothetical protein